MLLLYPELTAVKDREGSPFNVLPGGLETPLHLSLTAGVLSPLETAQRRQTTVLRV